MQVRSAPAAVGPGGVTLAGMRSFQLSPVTAARPEWAELCGLFTGEGQSSMLSPPLWAPLCFCLPRHVCQVCLRTMVDVNGVLCRNASLGLSERRITNLSGVLSSQPDA